MTLVVWVARAVGTQLLHMLQPVAACQAHPSALLARGVSRARGLKHRVSCMQAPTSMTSTLHRHLDAGHLATLTGPDRPALCNLRLNTSRHHVVRRPTVSSCACRHPLAHSAGGPASSPASDLPPAAQTHSAAAAQRQRRRCPYRVTTRPAPARASKAGAQELDQGRPALAGAPAVTHRQAHSVQAGRFAVLDSPHDTSPQALTIQTCSWASPACMSASCGQRPRPHMRWPRQPYWLRR